MEAGSGGMTTLSGVLEILTQRGYGKEFRLLETGRLQLLEDESEYDPADMKIIRTYRFEGDSNPSDAAVLYLLEHVSGLIGYIINAYGMYSDYDGDLFDNFIRDLKIEERDFE